MLEGLLIKFVPLSSTCELQKSREFSVDVIHHCSAKGAVHLLFGVCGLSQGPCCEIKSDSGLRNILSVRYSPQKVPWWLRTNDVCVICATNSRSLLL